MKLLTTILIFDLCLLWWAHGQPPTPPVLTSMEVSTNQAGTVGEPYGIQWAGGFTNEIQFIPEGHPEDPPMPKTASGPRRSFTAKKEPFKPFYRVKVWNDLLGDYVEFCAYAPGNTGFFQAELVTE